MSKILATSCGALGWPGIMKELREDEHKIIGVDCREEHHGKYLCDRFYRVPSYTDTKEYVSAIKKIVRRENVHFIFGGHTNEAIILQEAGFDNVLASPPDSLRIVKDKYRTYCLFSHLAPKFAKVTTSSELREEAKKMGFPRKELCIKPCISSGARGFRILVDDYAKSKWTFEHKTDPHITMNELTSLAFPPLLLMEYLKGPVHHVDILAYNGEVKKAVVSYRLEERFGFGFTLETIEKPEYVEMAREIVKRLKLSYGCFIQVINGKLIEVGGRMQGSVPIGLDLAKGAVRLAMGQEPELDKVGEMKMVRYWKELFVKEH